jgi:hypothetical protein
MATIKVAGTFCLETPAFGRDRVAFGDRQKVPATFFADAARWQTLRVHCRELPVGEMLG